jgi:hypothetical protein
MMAMAQANGILVDALYDAVDAFKETTKKQQALLGPEAAAEVQRLVAGFEALAPGAGMGELVRALTSPEAIRTLPAFASTIGISTPTDLRDPAQIRQFVLDAIPALAEFQQSQIAGSDPLAGFQISENLSNAFNQAFNLTNLQRANVLATKSGGDLATALNAALITSEEMEAMQRGVTGTSEEASMALQNFSVALATTAENFNVLDTVNEKLRTFDDGIGLSAERIREAGGDILTGIASTEAMLNRLGISAGAVSDFLLQLAGLKVGGSVLRSIFTRGGSAAAAGAGQAAAAAGASSRVAGMTDDALKAALQGVDDATLASLNIKRVGGRYFPTGAGTSGGQLSKRAVMEALESAGQLGRGSRVLGALGTGARTLGRAAPLIGSVLVGASEYSETGDLGKSAAVAGGGLLGGMLGGAALGAAAGSVTGPGALLTGLVGAIGGAFLGEAGVRAVYDDVADWFSDDEDAGELPLQEQARLEYEAMNQEERDAAWEERTRTRHDEHMALLELIARNTLPREEEPTSAYRVEGFGNPYDYMGTASAGGN